MLFKKTNYVTKFTYKKKEYMQTNTSSEINIHIYIYSPGKKDFIESKKIIF